MDSSIIATFVFTLIIGFGIAGAFWGRIRKRKLAVDKGFRKLKSELKELPTLLVTGKYPELDHIDESVKREKADVLEELLENVKCRLEEDRERFVKMMMKKEELENLVMKLGALGAKTEDLEELLETIKAEGID